MVAKSNIFSCPSNSEEALICASIGQRIAKLWVISVYRYFIKAVLLLLFSVDRRAKNALLVICCIIKMAVILPIAVFDSFANFHIIFAGSDSRLAISFGAFRSNEITSR